MLSSMLLRECYSGKFCTCTTGNPVQYFRVRLTRRSLSLLASFAISLQKLGAYLTSPVLLRSHEAGPFDPSLSALQKLFKELTF